MSTHLTAYAEVLALLQDYFDGLHHSDTQRLRRVFHPQALYATASASASDSASGGSPIILGMEAYYALVDARPSPASRGQARTDAVLAIEFAGPATALARLRCSIHAKHFIDLLSLIHVAGRWQVIAKVFHWEAADTPSPAAEAAAAAAQAGLAP